MDDLKRTNKIMRLLALCEKHQGDASKMIRDMTSWREKLMFNSTVESYIKEYSEKYEDLVDIVTFIDEDYPIALKASLFPPPILFSYGNKELLKEVDSPNLKMIISPYTSMRYFVIEKQLENQLVDYCILTTYHKDMPLALYGHLECNNFNYLHYDNEEQLLEMVEDKFIHKVNQNFHDWKAYISSNYKKEMEDSISEYPDYYDTLSM